MWGWRAAMTIVKMPLQRQARSRNANNGADAGRCTSSWRFKSLHSSASRRRGGMRHASDAMTLLTIDRARP